MNYKNCEVIVFFCGGINSYYQIQQWQKPFEHLDKIKKVLYIITDYEVYTKYISDNQIIEVVYLESFTNLIEFYENNEFPVILYINNSLKNFQSLRYSRGFHVHLNHGESEKESMRSNQSQAYDYVFTVGQRGIDRYKEYLLNFMESKYVKVGRPQLDFIEKMNFSKNENQKVILYAPTWEATHPSMNYTSVSKYGVFIVNEILNNPEYILIYKPHSALGSRNEDCKIANEEILKIIESNEKAYNMEKDNINNVFTIVDFALFDNTSVMIDYLHTNKPACYIEILEDQSINQLTLAFTTLNGENIGNLLEIIDKQLKEDENKSNRMKIKEYYLDNFEYMESTNKFIFEISKLIKIRNEKISKIKK